MELNQEQIIKGLECCASAENKCEECPINQKLKDDCKCGEFLAKNALELIKELTEEYTTLCGKYESETLKLGIENDRLNIKINRLKQYDEERDVALHKRLIDETKAATVKKMQEKLKERTHNMYPSIDSYCLSKKAVFVSDIDQIAKEILEDK